MKDTEFAHEYDYDWARVTSSFWKKYWHPKCSQSRALVLNRYIDEEGRLVTKRLHVIYQDVPSWVRAIIGDIVTYAGEESIADPKNKTLTLRTKNLNLTSIAAVDELCVYKPSREDATKTSYTKNMTVQGWMTGFVNCTLEGWFVDNDKKNRGNGINVMDEIIGGVAQLVLPLNRDINTM